MSPLPRGSRPPVLARLPGLLAGLVLCGSGIALMARSELGLGPWEAFHQGISRNSGIPLGTVSILVGIPVLLLWRPLRVRPGVGTLINVVLVGLSTNLVLDLVAAPEALAARLGLLALGLASFALGSSLYLAADLGPGPRDGLMTGLHRRLDWSIARSRTVLELAVLVGGVALGGTVGIGTLAFAVAIGPLIDLGLSVLDRDGRVRRRRSSPGAVGGGRRSPVPVSTSS